MAIIKFFVVLAILVAFFGPPLGVEALRCKCNVDPTSYRCNPKTGEQKCFPETTMCFKTTIKSKDKGEETAQEGCDDPPAFENAEAGKCIISDDKSINTCFCDKDFCNPGSGQSDAIHPCSWSWHLLFILSSSVIVVPTFIGGQ